MLVFLTVTMLMFGSITFNVSQASEPAVHIAPTVLFTFRGIEITNSMLYGWACSLFIVLLLTVMAYRVKLRPRRGWTAPVEIGAEFIVGQIESAFGSREKAVRYAPYFVALFFYIVLSNWLGLLPGVGEAFTLGEAPLLRPFTADLNGTLAAAAVTMLMVFYLTVKEVGFIQPIKHYFRGSLLNPLTWFLAILELITDSTRVFSLALRLFLNVAVGEIIIAVFSFIGKFAAPLTALPFFILELLVGALQAYIFVILAVMYVAVTIRASQEHERAEPMVAPAGKTDEKAYA